MITEFKRAKAFNPGTFLLLLYQGPINKYINKACSRSLSRENFSAFLGFPKIKKKHNDLQ